MAGSSTSSLTPPIVLRAIAGHPDFCPVL